MRNTTSHSAPNTQPFDGANENNSSRDLALIAIIFLIVIGSSFGLENWVELPDGLARYAKAGILTFAVLTGVAIQSLTSDKKIDENAK